MTKTINEAAKEAVRKEYLCEKCAWKENCDFCGGENTAFDCCECPADSFEDGFKAGANYVYGLTLASRLTAEEKESIKETYKYHLNAIGDCYTHCMVRDELVRIFGKDFFKEGE